ncbi:MAG: hypothetical protein IJI53_10005 [Clostridia bacterium]|nr:hypothetical protein [Clostridia bacterium]
MSETAQKIAETFDMLPEDQQKLAYELLKTMVRNWDPDFTKLTPSEAEALKEAENDPESFSMEEVLQELGITL